MAAPDASKENDTTINADAALVTNPQNNGYVYLNVILNKITQETDVSRTFCGTGPEDIRSEVQKWLPAVKSAAEKFLTKYRASTHPKAVAHVKDFDALLKRAVDLMPQALEADDLRAMINTVERKYNDLCSATAYWQQNENGGAKLKAILDAVKPKWRYFVEYCEKYGLKAGDGLKGAAAPKPETVQKEAAGRGTDAKLGEKRQAELLKVFQKYEPEFAKAEAALVLALQKDVIEDELKALRGECNAASVSQLAYAAKNRAGSVDPAQFKKLVDIFQPRFEAFALKYRPIMNENSRVKQFLTEFDPVMKLCIDLMPAVQEASQLKTDIAKLASGAALGGAVTRADVTADQFNRMYQQIKDCYEPFKAKYGKYKATNDEVKTIMSNYDPLMEFAEKQAPVMDKWAPIHRRLTEMVEVAHVKENHAAMGDGSIEDSAAFHADVALFAKLWGELKPSVELYVGKVRRAAGVLTEMGGLLDSFNKKVPELAFESAREELNGLAAAVEEQMNAKPATAAAGTAAAPAVDTKTDATGAAEAPASPASIAADAYDAGLQLAGKLSAFETAQAAKVKSDSTITAQAVTARDWFAANKAAVVTAALPELIKRQTAALTAGTAAVNTAHAARDGHGLSAGLKELNGAIAQFAALQRDVPAGGDAKAADMTALTAADTAAKACVVKAAADEPAIGKEQNEKDATSDCKQLTEANAKFRADFKASPSNGGSTGLESGVNLNRAVWTYKSKWSARPGAAELIADAEAVLIEHGFALSVLKQAAAKAGAPASASRSSASSSGSSSRGGVAKLTPAAKKLADQKLDAERKKKRTCAKCTGTGKIKCTSCKGKGVSLAKTICAFCKPTKGCGYEPCKQCKAASRPFTGFTDAEWAKRPESRK